MSDGVVNPAGWAWAGATGIYLACVPLTSYLTSDGSVVQRVMETVLSAIPGSAGITKERTIPALSALYLFATFAASGAVSVGAQAAGRREGYDNDKPRLYHGVLTGLPMRLRSAHLNMMENFPAFALTAALAFSSARGNQQIVNLLGYHVLTKVFVYYPAYAFELAPVRSFCHLSATGALINVLWRLSTGAA